MKKKMAVLISAIMAASCATVCMAAITFSDINNVPWEGAKNYIVKVADLGLMVGQENSDGTSLFRAKDKVTYCETVQLIYNILKDDGKAKPSTATTVKWTSVMKGYKIPEWAYESVAYCLENDIISTEELSGFVENSGTNKNATREDVALIFGRALADDVDDDFDLDFKDNASISKVAAPYVKVLATEGILVGDDDKNFNPKKLINRAEMAVVTTKTYGVVSDKDVDVSDSSTTGTITSIGKSANNSVSKITLTLSNNTKLVLTGVKGTPTTKGTASIDFMSLSTGDVVTVKYVGSVITSVIVNSDFAQGESEKTVSGTLNNITGDKIAVDFSDDKSDVYNISSLASITLNGENATVSKILNVIENGMKVDVSVKLSGGMATAITATGEEDVVEGVINKITSKEIRIKRTSSTEKTYSFADYVKVKYDEETSRISKVVDAFDEDIELFVRAEIDEDGDIDKITVTYSQEGGTARGLVKKITDEKISLSTTSGKSTGYDFSGKPKVTFEDEEITLSKLEDKVEDGTAITAKVYLNSKKRVTKIEAVIDDNNRGTITNLTDTYITILTDSGYTRKCLIDEDVVVRYSEGSNVNFEDFKDVYVKDDTEVTLTFNSKDTVVKIVANLDEDSYDKVSGSVNSMGESSIKVAKKTVYLSEDTVVKIDDKVSTAAELYKRYNSGEEMDATVSYSDDVARTINVEVIGTTGTLTDMKKGYITLSTQGGVRQYAVADSEDFVVRYDGEKKAYDFQDLYTRWYINGEKFNVECTLEDGVIVKVEAENI